ncbi:hypothetical protein GPY51_23225 [Photorhabdus laumondii subsp. laumondii]|uniref:Photorhabdus luminescens subsp. laumondii TTO1 complete genome segment 2/17 n=2 Tax=Photorhabdus laumondii subsp. laumondii TaxID=141679 RepID=Q7N9I3_PHOLL|nr:MULTISPECIES: hypothetical protein [Photorhabdus]AWK40323.1 hypothetical protein A4R40_01705 [Photorhabdus laumondii subsp. laumondii]AXG45664.1 hypothetical protein PluTT01m_01780 [Photorhabdus laumondii subsp. laumondii]KTL62253.1 hypothetical protein AA106_21035 [Photorhabdus laumondii subsp. laumondii]MCC8415714.1 hypothetical protein [Photorhabdus laumondii]NDK97215.1 hypothetical protein [Photorhabdus laumondii subsp. laumondii]
MTIAIEHLQDIQLTHLEALALAQLVKRLNWAEIRACAVNDEEAYQIKDALGKLQSALAYRGYAPR